MRPTSRCRGKRKFRYAQMVRALGFIALVFTLLVFENALSKPAACVRAYAAIEAKQAEYLVNPPTAPLRYLTKDDLAIVPLNDGKPFKYEYDGQADLWRPGLATGYEIRFKSPTGEARSVKVVGKTTRPAQIEAVTEMVAKLPADTLEATKLVEIQTFVENNGTGGYAIKRGFVVLPDGAHQGLIRHEFGHNLAEMIWGTAHPYVGWEKAFAGDGSKFVSGYAQRSFKQWKYAEDFAEAVMAYLHDAQAFRAAFPNRAALLDTVFRDEELWRPIRDHNNTVIARALRLATQDPETTSLILIGTAATGGVIAAVNLLPESEFKLPPTRPENPR